MYLKTSRYNSYTNYVMIHRDGDIHLDGDICVQESKFQTDA